MDCLIVSPFSSLSHELSQYLSWIHWLHVSFQFVFHFSPFQSWWKYFHHTFHFSSHELSQQNSFSMTTFVLYESTHLLIMVSLLLTHIFSPNFSGLAFDSYFKSQFLWARFWLIFLVPISLGSLFTHILSPNFSGLTSQSLFFSHWLISPHGSCLLAHKIIFVFLILTHISVVASGFTS